MSAQDLTPKIRSLERPQEIINVHQNNLNTDNKNRLLFNDENTSSNTPKINEINPISFKSEESLEYFIFFYF